MTIKNKVLGSLTGFGLLLSVTSGAIAKPSIDASPLAKPHPIIATQHHSPTAVKQDQSPVTEPHQPATQIGQFRQIEQPVTLKIAVTLGSFALIGLELWWFLWSKTKPRQAESHQGVQELGIMVDGGYKPDRVVVKAGQPVRLSFDRRDPSSCLEALRIPDFHIAQDLPLNQVTSIEFTPTQRGEYQFTCGMNMFRGVIEVQETERSEATAQNLVSQRS